MARRLPNQLPAHEPSVVVDPRLFLDALDRLDVPPDAPCARDATSEPPGGAGRMTLLRAVTLVVLSACASFSCVRFVRTQLAGTAHAALIVTPLARPPAPALVPLPLSPPAPPLTPPRGEAAEPAWMQRVQRARAQLAAGRLEEAEATFRAVLAERAQIPAAQLGLARVRLARGDCGEASQLAAMVLARLPQNHGARDVLAACLRAEGSAAGPAAALRVAAARDAALPANPF